MSRKKLKRPTQVADGIASDRRRFLESMALSAGAIAMLTGSGATRTARAQSPAQPPVLPQVASSQTPPLKDLAGKTAYITAAADGIGLGIARACSNAGMKVVIGYRNDQRLQQALPLFKPGAPVHAIRHDVTDRDGWTRLLEEIKGTFGNLHLLVNNAGVKTLAKASEAKVELWDNCVAVNFTAIYNGVQTCIPHMRAHGEGGHIVTTASMGGLLPGASAGAGVYTATKIAAVGLMEALRIELCGSNIGTSAFCPGIVVTDNRPESQRKPLPPPPPGAPPRPKFEAMDPLEAGERVLNGVRNNDLFILTHPEFRDGMQERCDAVMGSVPDEPTPPPPGRVAFEKYVLHSPIYAPEIAHRRVKRKSYRS